MAVKTTVIADVIAYLQQIGSAPEQTPYETLLSNMRAAGHQVYLKESAINPCADASVAVSFDVLVGPAPDSMERLDGLTTRVQAQAPHISLTARLQAEVALVYMLFGRLPPAVQQAAEAPAPRPDLDRGQMNGHEHDKLEPEWKSAPEEIEQEYEKDPLDDYDNPAPLNVIARREADGLPIFIDLYDSGERAADLIAAVMAEIETFLGEAKSLEQVDALPRKNPEMMSFIKDLGETADKQRLLDLVTRRKGQIAAGVNPRRPSEAPRRRAAGARAN